MPLTFQLEQCHGLPCVRLHGDDDASALIALHGAHLLSWKTGHSSVGNAPADGRERLFLSERARFAEGAAIRGGIPVIFPQFAGRGPLPKHGFARTLPWRFAGVDQRATFELTHGPATAAWPRAFTLRLQIGLGAGALAIALEVINTGDEAFDFTAALHSYLAVDDVEAAALHGLDGCRYEDSVEDGAARQQAHDVLRFTGEVDRIYGAPSRPLVLHDGPHRTTIEQHGFADTVVWNPGAALAATIADLAPHEYRRFVCVEAGQVLQPVHLPPSARWSGTQYLR